MHNQLARPAFVQQDYLARTPINKAINPTEWWAPQANVRYSGILNISKTCQWEFLFVVRVGWGWGVIMEL